MERQLAHMIRLIDDLLDISRINSGKIRLETRRTRLADGDRQRAGGQPPGHARAGATRWRSTCRPHDIELMADATRLAQALGQPAEQRGQVHARRQAASA